MIMKMYTKTTVRLAVAFGIMIGTAVTSILGFVPACFFALIVVAAVLLNDRLANSSEGAS